MCAQEGESYVRESLTCVWASWSQMCDGELSVCVGEVSNVYMRASARECGRENVYVCNLYVCVCSERERVLYLIP